MEAQTDDPVINSCDDVPPTGKLVEITETANNVEVAPQQVEVELSDNVVSMATVPLTAPQLQITAHAAPVTTTATVFLDVLNQTIQIPISVGMATSDVSLREPELSDSHDSTTLTPSLSLQSSKAPSKRSTSGVGKKGKERSPWHFHLGGVRHCRVPLTPALKEVLEVAYVSRIMSKNFRKEGQPEKERISRITGLEIEKVQEWFKNRRKKDKLLQNRNCGFRLPKGRRGRKPIMPLTLSSVSTPYHSTPQAVTTSKPPASLLAAQSIGSSQQGSSPLSSSSQSRLGTDSTPTQNSRQDLASESLSKVDSPVCNSAVLKPTVAGASDRLVALATQAANVVTNVAPV